MAPQVQTLAQVMAELNPAYQGQTDVIAKKQAGVGARYDSQRTALGAEKVQGFNKINDQAIGRGAAFSGIPLDEQATYLSTKYLPGLQATDKAQNDEVLSYEEQLAKINTDKTNNALGRIDSQKKDLTSWQMQEASLAAQARENAANRAAQAAEGAANRSAASAKAQGDGRTTGQIGAWVQKYVKNKQGKIDRKISPQAYRNGYAEFYAYSGGDPSTYQALMSGYVNTKHAQDYVL